MQDESVQFRTGNIEGLASQLHQPEVVKPKVTVDPNQFGNPIRKNPVEPQFLQGILEQEQRDRIARDSLRPGVPIDENAEVPVSMWTEVHGETPLKVIFGIDSDNANTMAINDYILQKMIVGKMEDTKSNYEKVLSKLLAHNNLSMNQQKPYLLRRLSLYLNGRNLSDDDDIVLSILNAKRGKKNGIRR